jgi:uncharacterized membrane protein
MIAKRGWTAAIIEATEVQMGGQVGSTFGGGGLGGPVVILLYIIFGPGAAIFHSVRLTIHVFRMRSEHRAFLSPSERDTARSCLPWNIGITLIPLLGMFLSNLK